MLVNQRSHCVLCSYTNLQDIVVGTARSVDVVTRAHDDGRIIGGRGDVPGLELVIGEHCDDDLTAVGVQLKRGVVPRWIP